MRQSRTIGQKRGVRTILVFLVFAFGVTVLSPTSYALDRDPNQPKVDEKGPWATPGGDDGGWGGHQAMQSFFFDYAFDLVILSLSWNAPSILKENSGQLKSDTPTVSEYERNTETSSIAPLE